MTDPTKILPVLAYKRELLETVMREIIRLGGVQTFIYPGDIREDIVAPEHRQGVASNAWNTLCELGIIEKLPLNFTSEPHKIFGGRKRNTNPKRKGAWCAVYRRTAKPVPEDWADEVKWETAEQLCLV